MNGYRSGTRRPDEKAYGIVLAGRAQRRRQLLLVRTFATEDCAHSLLRPQAWRGPLNDLCGI
jgi:hypothetical protein